MSYRQPRFGYNGNGSISNGQEYCTAEGKLKIENRGSARAQLNRNPTKDKLTIYHCKHCHFWHIGHKIKNRFIRNLIAR